MDLELLISLVCKRPTIWDKRESTNSNREAIDACWEVIGEEMKEDVHMIRKKWKYLRDQFCVEWGKSVSSNIDSKWRHYKLLEFLKEAVVPRTIRYGYIDEVIRETPKETTEVNESSKDSDEILVERHLKRALSKHTKMKIESAKKHRTSVVLAPEMEYQESYVNDEEDEHLHFFKSILPHVKKIPHSRLLSFRSRIQSVVEEFAYGASSTGHISQLPRLKVSPRYETEPSDPIYTSE